jgi:hypothetical protein
MNRSRVAAALQQRCFGLQLVLNSRVLHSDNVFLYSVVIADLYETAHAAESSKFLIIILCKKIRFSQQSL